MRARSRRNTRALRRKWRRSLTTNWFAFSRIGLKMSWKVQPCREALKERLRSTDWSPSYSSLKFPWLSVRCILSSRRLCAQAIWTLSVAPLIRHRALSIYTAVRAVPWSRRLRERRATSFIVIWLRTTLIWKSRTAMMWSKEEARIEFKIILLKNKWL